MRSRISASYDGIPEPECSKHSNLLIQSWTVINMTADARGLAHMNVRITCDSHAAYTKGYSGQVSLNHRLLDMLSKLLAVNR
jgi:hypothetical protein